MSRRSRPSHYSHNLASQNKSKKGRSTPSASFGGYLRDLRARREFTLREVAAAVGMDQAHLSKAELGQRLPTPAQANALARFFGQDPVEFEAHWIAEKFRRRHAGSASALHAIRLLHSEQHPGEAAMASGGGRTSLKKKPAKKARPTGAEASPPAQPLPTPEPAAESIPENSPGVTVLHLD